MRLNSIPAFSHQKVICMKTFISVFHEVKCKTPRLKKVKMLENIPIKQEYCMSVAGTEADFTIKKGRACNNLGPPAMWVPNNCI